MQGGELRRLLLLFLTFEDCLFMTFTKCLFPHNEKLMAAVCLQKATEEAKLRGFYCALPSAGRLVQGMEPRPSRSHART